MRQTVHRHIRKGKDYNLWIGSAAEAVQKKMATTLLEAWGHSHIGVDPQTAPKDPLRWCGIKSTVPGV
jgi:hypothetical protein